MEALDQEWLLTNVVLHVTDVEGRGRHGQAQTLFLLSQDGLAEAVLLQMLHSQLSAAQLHKHIVSAAPQTNDIRGGQRFRQTHRLVYETPMKPWLPWKRPTAQLLYKHLAAVLNRFDICALSCVIFTPVPFLFY